MHKLKVLICDDMEHVRLSHEHHVEQFGGKIFLPETRLAESAEEAVRLCEGAAGVGTPYDLVLLDIDFGQVGGERRMDGFKAANRIHRISPSTIIVMISAYSTEDNLMLAEQSPWVEKFLRRGSFSKSELFDVCHFALVRKLHAQGALLPIKEVTFTRSPIMLDYLKKVDRISAAQNVVIYGETGTGKELTAKRLNASARAISGQPGRPLVTINCGGLTETLQTSELFGYTRGAYTGANQDTPGLLEKAEGGDVFLDELQNAPKSLQEVLMRVLNDKCFTPVGARVPKKLNVRFITALNQSPTEAKKSGSLKPDLLARLQQDYLVIPPLRERQGDVSALVEHFKTIEGQADKTFSKEALEFLEAMPWTTNVRGLSNVVSEAIRHSKVPVIRTEVLEQLPSVREMRAEVQAMLTDTAAHSGSLSPLAAKVDDLVATWLDSDAALDEPIKTFEKAVLTHMWRQHPSIARVARRSKMAETTVRRKLAEYGIAGERE